MTTVARQFVLTISEDQAKGLAALLRKGVKYATKQELGISDLEYNLSAALGWFEAPEFGVKATLTSNEDALQALRDSLAT
jgi:hypothetical protein